MDWEDFELKVAHLFLVVAYPTVAGATFGIKN